MNSLKARLGIGIIVCGVVATSASAQDEQALRRGLIRCAALETPEARLICFEALADLVQPLEGETAAKPSPAPSAPRAAPSPEDSEQEKRDFGSKRLKQPEQTTSKAETPAPSAPVEKEPEGIAYRVLHLTKDGERRYVFRMENGQVWRQIEPSYLRVPKYIPFDVRIAKGTFGDYKLRIGGEGRFSRVIRIK